MNCNHTLRAAALLALYMLTLPMMSAKTKKNIVWQNPKTTVSQASVLDIERVELADTATTISFLCTQLPHYWVQISSGCKLVDTAGNTYALKSTENITTDAHFWMPDSGRHHFKMHFEPLPKKTVRFDFMEGEKKNDWKFFDIHSADTKLDLGIAKGAKDYPQSANESLPAIKSIKPTKTTIRCRYYGYRPAMNQTLRLTYSSMNDNGTVNLNIPFDENGIAEKEIEIEGPKTGFLIINGASIQKILLTPGEAMVLPLYFTTLA